MLDKIFKILKAKRIKKALNNSGGILTQFYIPEETWNFYSEGILDSVEKQGLHVIEIDNIKECSINGYLLTVK